MVYRFVDRAVSISLRMSTIVEAVLTAVAQVRSVRQAILFWAVLMVAALVMLVMMLVPQGVVILQEQVGYLAALVQEVVPLVFPLITQQSVAEIARAAVLGVPPSALRMAVVLIRA